MSKILYIGETAGFTGGIERYMAQTAELLRTAGHQVIFAGSGQTGRFPEQFLQSFTQAASYEDLNGLCAAADLIVLHKILPAPLLALLPVEKTLFLVHDHQAYCRRHHYYTPLGRSNCRRPYARLRCLICSLGRNTPPPLPQLRRFSTAVLSDFMKENLILNGFAPDRIHKIPPFVTMPEASRHKPFLQDGILHILFLGQLVRGKGADLMLKTLQKLSIPFRAEIAGEGKDRPWLEQMARRSPSQQEIHFLGWQPRPEQLFRDADLLFFPSRWQEPFGLVGLEALSRGVPVAGFHVGGAGEWLRHRETGLAIPERDTDAAAQALEFCFRHPDLLEKWSTAGRELVRTSFSPERFLRNFQQLLQEVRP